MKKRAYQNWLQEAAVNYAMNRQERELVFFRIDQMELAYAHPDTTFQDGDGNFFIATKQGWLFEVSNPYGKEVTLRCLDVMEYAQYEKLTNPTGSILPMLSRIGCLSTQYTLEEMQNGLD